MLNRIAWFHDSGLHTQYLSSCCRNKICCFRIHGGSSRLIGPPHDGYWITICTFSGEREFPVVRRRSPRPAAARLQRRRKPHTHASDADEFSDQRDQKSKRHKDSPDREEPPYKIAPVHPHLTHAHGDLSASACTLCQCKPYRSSSWSPRCSQATMQRDRRNGEWTDNFVHNSCRQRVQPYRHLKSWPRS